MYLIVCYDIENDKARTKISKILFNFGLKRVQKSVFEGIIKTKQFPNLQKQLAAYVTPKAGDSIRYYHLCADCRPKTIVQGVEKVKIEDDPVIIV